MLDLSGCTMELQALLDAAVDGVILIDSQGRIENFDRSAERLFGYTATQAIGQSVAMLVAEPDQVRYDKFMEHPRSTDPSRIVGRGRAVTGRRSDGTSFPGLLSLGRIAEADPPRYVGVFRDLTPQEQALNTAVRERDRALGFLEAAQTMLVALDSDGRITLANRRAREILGRDEAELLLKNWFEIVVAPEERAAATSQFAKFIANGSHVPCHGEYHVRTARGTSRLIAWRYVLTPDPVAGRGVLCSAEDVTDARMGENTTLETHARLMHVSRLATVGEMASGIAHELNQPLAAITTYAQAASRLLKAAPGELDEVGEALIQIAAQGLRAGEIIRSLRNIVGNRDTQREPTAINALIEDLELVIRADARAKKVRIVLALAPSLPLADLDRIQIQHVVLNLVGNAVQALQSAPAADCEVVIATGLRADGEIEVEVRDLGPGVTDDVLGKLFLPFATTKVNGTGLGLAASRSIIEAHGGTLEYRPNLPHGACFFFRLPTLKDAGI